MMQLPKPPKLFHTKKETSSEVQTETVPEQNEEAPRVWSPAPQPTMPGTPIEPTPAVKEEEDLSRYAPPAETNQPADDEFIPEPSEKNAEEMLVPNEPEQDFSNSAVAEAVPVEEESAEPIVSDAEKYARPRTDTVPTDENTEETADDSEKYARPKEEDVSVKDENDETDNSVTESTMTETTEPDLNDPLAPEENEKAIYRLLGKKQKIVRAKSVSSIPFSDIWYTAEKVAYIRDDKTRFALVPFLSDDLTDFYKALEQGYTGQSSYAIRFAGESYRVERIITLAGAQYNCRKMPGSVPDIHTLGLPKHVVDYLLTLSQEAGLILFGGPTGMGKTTSASALMKRFLEENGGFMYTIEDPPEMPLDGLYHAENGGLGLCKQCPVDNERWGDGIKSALRSRPRYILVGEIRTPETASQVLRAATSGHLVLSTIHASTVEDALESIIKYASGAGLTESLAADLLARGILAVVHQKLEGSTTLRPVITAAFANPHLSGGDQMRSLIRNNNINLQTLIEAQSSRLFQGRPLFEEKKDTTTSA